MATTKNVRDINKAVHLQAIRGTRNVRTQERDGGFRVIRAKTVKGQLKVKLLSGEWIDVESVNID